MSNQVPGMQILPLQEQHIEELLILARAIWYAHYPDIISVEQIEYMLSQRYRPEIIRAQMASGTHWWSQLRLNGEMLAFSACELSEKPGEMKLDKLYVHHQRHRLGLGSQLLRHVEDIAHQQRCHTLYLQVNKQNAKAISAYLRNGFFVRESVTFDIGRGFVMDDYVMAKTLGAAP